VSDPQRLLQGRLVTLDTGEVTFWQALDKFCESAHLLAAGLPRAGGEATAIQADKVPAGPGDGAAKPRAIVLSDGKPPSVATDARTSFRVRVREQAKDLGIPAEGVALLALEITPELGMRNYHVRSLQVKKATNEEGRSLEQLLDKAQIYSVNPPAKTTTPEPGSDSVIALVDPKNTTKAAKSLKEISGTIRVRVTTGAQPNAGSIELEVPFTLTNVPLQ
jgi:hypothetical protein